MNQFVLYKDWDGVTNAHQPPHGDTLKVSVPVPNHRYLLDPSEITYSPFVIEILDRLRTQYDVELVWVTTWNYDQAVLRLPEHIGGLMNGRVLEAALNHEAKSKSEWTRWKAQAIVFDQLINPRPFIWVDDNAHEHWGDFVKENTTAPSLLISTESAIGLTKDELISMEYFYAENLRKD